MATAKAVASARAMAMASPPERTRETALAIALANWLRARDAENAWATIITVPPVEDALAPAAALPPDVLDAPADVPAIAVFCNKALESEPVSSLA